MVAKGHHLPEDQAMPKLQKQSYNTEHKANEKMVAEGHHLPEDQVMPRLDEQSYNKEHKAKKKRS